MKYFALLISFLSSLKSISQNLLVNGGFEDENICTEYKINCAPEAWISTGNAFSNYFKNPLHAYQGKHCITVEAGVTDRKYLRTFFRSRLLCGLRNGKKYRVEFYLKSLHPILDSTGIYFSPNDILFEKNSLLKVTPAFFSSSSIEPIIKNDTNWQRISIDYIANGKELFLSIGNFSKRDINQETGIFRENKFFIYVDNISLVPLDFNEKICNDWKITKEEIYEQNERHEYLNKLIAYYHRIDQIPEPPKISTTIVTIIDTLVLPEILFESGKAVLNNKSYLMLDSFCRKIISSQVDSVVIEGHTDSIGSLVSNSKLSNERAKSVTNYFTSNCKVTQSFFITRGWGAAKPIADNKTPNGRQQNRRVEILLYTRD